MTYGGNPVGTGQESKSRNILDLLSCLFANSLLVGTRYHKKLLLAVSVGPSGNNLHLRVNFADSNIAVDYIEMVL